MANVQHATLGNLGTKSHGVVKDAVANAAALAAYPIVADDVAQKIVIRQLDTDQLWVPITTAPTFRLLGGLPTITAADLGKPLLAQSDTTQSAIWSGDFLAQPLSGTGSLSFGATPRSTTGNFRTSQGYAFKYMNLAGSADLPGIDFGLAEADTVTVGDSVGLVQSKFIAGSRNVVALCRSSGALAAVQMPAGSGDGVLALEDASSVPAANPAAGRSVLYSANGCLRFRSPDGLIRRWGGE